MPSKPKFVDIRSYARKFTVEALETLAHVMRQPKAPPAARVMAANALLDRGWGKAAQLVAVDGEVRQLVEVKLNVVAPNSLGPASPGLPSDAIKTIEHSEIKTLDAGARCETNSDLPGDANKSRRGLGPSPGRGGGESSGEGGG